MAKGPLLNDEVRQLITEIYLDHKDWRAKQVQKELHSKLKAINPNTPDNWPALSTIQAILKDAIYKDKLVIERGVDKPWGLSTLEKYPIAAEALPSVLKVWIFHQDEFVNSLSDEDRNVYFFTIREAKWAAQLYKILEDIPSLTAFAFTYARIERVLEVSGITTLGTAVFDMLLYSKLTNRQLEPELVTNIFDRLSEHDKKLTSKMRDAGIWKQYLETLYFQSSKEERDERTHSKKV